MNSKRSNILSNNWVITLTATLVGVFLALFLNEKMSSRNTNIQKEIAIENVLFEIAANQKILDKSIVKHTELYDFLDFHYKYKGSNEDLIAPQDSMAKFRSKHPNLISIKDSTIIEEGVYLYKGSTDFEISLPNLNLTNIAWKTMIHSGINASYDFECLMYLEKTDKLLNEVIKTDEITLDYLLLLLDDEIEPERIVKHLESLMHLETFLNAEYKKGKDRLSNCG